MQRTKKTFLPLLAALLCALLIFAGIFVSATRPAKADTCEDTLTVASSAETDGKDEGKGPELGALVVIVGVELAVVTCLMTLLVFYATKHS